MIRDDGRIDRRRGPDRRAGRKSGGETFDVVGFGGVIVTRTRRGQGLARRVMEAAIARAAELGPERGLLFCRPDRAGLYTKPRLRQARRARSTSASWTASARTMPLDTMWRPLAPDATWPAGPVSVARPAVLTLTRSVGARRAP